MGLIYDLITIVIFILFIIFGYEKGFIRSVLNFISYFIIIIVSAFLSLLSANLIFDNFIREQLREIIVKNINSTVDGFIDVPNIISQISSSLSPITTIFGNEAIENTSVMTNITESLNNLGNATTNNVLNIIKPIVVNAIAVLLFIVISILLSLIVKFISKKLIPIKKHKSLPVSIDGFFGGVIGFAKGFIIITVIGFVLHLLIEYVQVDNTLISYDVINSTFVFKYFYQSVTWDNLIKSIII